MYIYLCVFLYTLRVTLRQNRHILCQSVCLYMSISAYCKEPLIHILLQHRFSVKLLDGNCEIEFQNLSMPFKTNPTETENKDVTNHSIIICDKIVQNMEELNKGYVTFIPIWPHSLLILAFGTNGVCCHMSSGGRGCSSFCGLHGASFPLIVFSCLQTRTRHTYYN